MRQRAGRNVRALGEIHLRERGERRCIELVFFRGTPEKAEARAAARLHGERDVLQHGKRGRIDVIWNERARPRVARAEAGRRVTVSPPNMISPASGASNPEIWLISVVLPAPFGPITACSSPGITSSVMLSVTRRPPKFLVSPSMRSTGSATADPPQPRRDAEQPAAREHRDQHEQRPEDHLPVLGKPDSHSSVRRNAAAPMIAPLSVPMPPKITMMSSSPERCHDM